jgi:RNA polymerase sigma-70 factor (ECF subfamily)
VALALAGEVEAGLALIDGIDSLDDYAYLHSARADLLRRLDRHDEAAAAYTRALDLTDNARERAFLERRLVEVSA